MTAALPEGLSFIERGWLSANNILLQGPAVCALIDSGYVTHADQTLALVGKALDGRPLDLLLNTHLHSDHCGGNLALQQRYPGIQTLIPPGQADQVRQWDPEALTYVPTGQRCSRFSMTGVLQPGTGIALGSQVWEIHGSPGHDPHSVILFEPGSRTLISADALWESGFGVVFPELEGEDAFALVGQTLDCIESLAPALVLPGHGPMFTDVRGALDLARRRLEAFVTDPARHARHAAKVLLKFKLLEDQWLARDRLREWARETRYLAILYQRWFNGAGLDEWIDALCADLVRSGAARIEGTSIMNA